MSPALDIAGSDDRLWEIIGLAKCHVWTGRVAVFRTCDSGPGPERCTVRSPGWSRCRGPFLRALILPAHLFADNECRCLALSSRSLITIAIIQIIQAHLGFRSGNQSPHPTQVIDPLAVGHCQCSSVLLGSPVIHLCKVRHNTLACLLASSCEDASSDLLG